MAQIDVHIGASTTVNASFLLDQGINTDPQYVQVQSYDMAPIGASFGLDFNKNFGLQLESIISNFQKAYEIKEQITNTDIGQLKFDMQYLNLPLLLKFMGGNDNRARMNFMFGPQLSVLTQGQEALKLYQAAANGELSIPDIGEYDPLNNNGTLPEGTIQNADGSFTLPANMPAEGFESNLLLKDSQNKYSDFRDKEIHIVAGFGLDVDVSPKLYISMIVKADYGLTDMRNGDLIDQLANSTLTSVEDLFDKRANLAVGAQISVHYMFNGTRFFLKAL